MTFFGGLQTGGGKHEEAGLLFSTFNHMHQMAKHMSERLHYWRAIL